MGIHSFTPSFTQIFYLSNSPRTGSSFIFPHSPTLSSTFRVRPFERPHSETRTWKNPAPCELTDEITNGYLLIEHTTQHQELEVATLSE